MRGSSLEDARIDSQVPMIKDREARFLCEIIFVFRKNDVIQSDIHTADQCCRAVFCNCLNCQLRQAFNKCKLIFSVSKIYPACTVYVAFACHVPRLSHVNHQLRQASNGLKQENMPATCPMDKLQSLTKLVETLIALKDPSKVFQTKKGKIKLFLDPHPLHAMFCCSSSYL